MILHNGKLIKPGMANENTTLGQVKSIQDYDSRIWSKEEIDDFGITEELSGN